MKKLLARLVWAPLGAIVVLFLVANRHPVSISLDPISGSAEGLTSPPLPLWIWLAAMLLAGVFAGAAGMWLSGRSGRRRARAERRELAALKSELAARREAESGPPVLPPA